MALSTQFAYRKLKGIGVVNADPVYEPLPGLTSLPILRPEGNLRCCIYSPCGRFFAWASPEEVTIIDASIGSVIATLPLPNVYEVEFSPRGTFIATWERPAKDQEGNATKNLKVWRVVGAATDADEEGFEEKAVIGKFVQRSQSAWNLQYKSDELYCARMVTNEIQFYQGDDLASVWNKLRVEGVVDFALSPGDHHSVAVFIPERKGQPAAVKVFNFPEFSAPVSQKTFFKGDKVQLKWNKLGTTLIVLAQTEVDKTGKSYYGETNLYLLSANGDFDSRVQLDKEGPIHDVTWSPNSKRFGVVYGYMPAKTTLFNARGVATHSFPLAPRNTISFSPNGRFVLVAGFGNLAGQIDIYDCEKDYHKVTTLESGNPSVCQWSVDGKFILTATTSPRLRVDNGVKIWHVGGSLLYNEDMTELYDVIWRPGTPGLQTTSDPLHPIPTPHASAVTYLGTVKTPSKPAGAYRPPGARGQVTPLHFKREDEGGAAHINNGTSSSSGHIVNSFGRSKRRDVPGAGAALPPGAAPGGGVSLTGTNEADEGLSKAALKNKKKREAKKTKETAGTSTPAPATKGDGEATSDKPHLSQERKDRRGHIRSQSRNELQSRSRSRPQRRDRSIRRSAESATAVDGFEQGSSAGKQGTETASADVSVTSPNGGSLDQKKLRSLLKKLRAIEDLKMRMAGGEKLEDTQVKKISSEDSVRKELEEMGWNG
ncbi:MAG: hypothetical protein M1816_005552 [Peltula sp. TS41687]|nr:MAG: hypothetical protein M1816_005552 [Peltula sp. TS41687]